MNQSKPINEVGLVVKAKRYIMTIEGLPSARVNDMLVDENGNRAIVRSLRDEYVEALSLGDGGILGSRYTYLKDQNLFYGGDELFGRVIDTFGRPIDNKGSLPPANLPLRLEVEAPGVEVREHIHEQLHTGLSIVDTLIPIAKGQRQLIFGPIRSGKSTFLTSTVQMQAGRGTVCIYTVIGKPINNLRKITDTIIAEAHPDSKNIVIAALSDEPASVIVLAPSVAFLLAEYYQQKGEHVLVILDDLDAHAKYLREIALLEGRLPSTESYPGDIFYQHAHLMERSGHFTKEIGGGSITALPVIQTDLKNFSDLIPTNVMACTDGHLSFLPQLRAEGIYPSISIEQSVTRVGRQAQKTLQKQVTRHVQTLLGSYRTQQEYAKFSADLSEHAKDILRRGRLVEVALQQPPYSGRDTAVQVLLLGLVFTNFFADKKDDYLVKNREAILSVLSGRNELQALRSMVEQNEVTWEVFIETLQSQHQLIDSYVSNS